MLGKILNNRMYKFLFLFIKLFIFIILFIYISFVVFQRLSDNSALFGYRLFTVASGSMEPDYNINDVIYVKEVESDTLKVGDDIAYQGNSAGFEGLIITHRIIAIEEDSDGKLRIFTQGINNENLDPSISEEQVLGKVCGKVFFINTLNHVVKNKYGFFLLIICPVCLVIVLEIYENVRAFQDKNSAKYGGSDSDKLDEKIEILEFSNIEEEEDII